MRFPPSFLDEIRNRVPVSAVVAFIPQVVIGIVTFLIWRVQQNKRLGRAAAAAPSA